MFAASTTAGIIGDAGARSWPSRAVVVNRKNESVLTYLDEAFHGYQVEMIPRRGKGDYVFRLARDGAARFWLRIRPAFMDAHSAEAIPVELERLDVAAALRRGRDIVLDLNGVQPAEHRGC